MSDHLAEDPACDRHDDLRQHGRHAAAQSDEPAERRRQEAGSVGRDLPELPGGDPEVLRADDTVDEADRERQALRVGEDPGELLRRAVDRVRLGLGQPLPHEGDGAVGERVVVGGGGRLEVGHGISVEFRKR